MAGTAEIGAELVETALTFAPWLVDVPVLGRILIFISPHGGNDFEAIEELQKQAEHKKTDRKTRIDKQARYVLKANDAMRCVEDNLMNGAFLLTLGKALLNTVAGRGGANAPDLIADRIFTCIERKVLKQTGKRTRKNKPYYGRPSKGHGHGRVIRSGAQPTPPTAQP